jgi:hypothetical protein
VVVKADPERYIKAAANIDVDNFVGDDRVTDEIERRLLRLA